MQDLANQLEDALKYRVTQGGFAVSIYTGQGDADKVTPSLVIHASDGNENPLGSGNFTISVSCEFRYPTQGDDIDDHKTLCRNVLGELMVSTLADTLSTEATDLHIFGVSNRQMRSGIEENHWLSVLTFDCYCCILDLA